jgi:AGCS family alanine or glycine:cation symporter
MIGSSFLALRVGCSRGVFTNEAGLGTASIAHAAAEGVHPAAQGLMGIMEVFLDTIVICTLTALVILCSGIPMEYGYDAGAALTSRAFCAVLGDWAGVLIAAFLSLFAFATILGWGLYGARCAEYLFGQGIWRKFTLLQMIVVVLGAGLNTAMLWRMAEIVNGLMAIPNLIALWALSPKFKQLLLDFNCGRSTADGGTYEDFHQCKPLRAFSYAEIPSPCSEGQGGRQKNLPSEYRSA